MKKRIRIVLILGVLAVVAAVAFSRSGWLRNNHDNNTIRLSGNLELTQVDIGFKTAGRLMELYVREGDMVKKGQAVARIDQESTRHQRERDEAGVQMAELGLAQMRTNVEYQREALAGETALRKAELEAAEARLRELEAGSRPQEIQQAHAVVEEARTQHRQAERDWARAQTLYKNDDISTAQFDQFRMKFEASAAALKRAEETAKLVEEGPRKETIEAQRAQVARARAALKLAEAARLELKRKEQEVATRRVEIERARQQLGVMDVQLSETVAYSPMDGVVMVKSVDPGQVVAAGTSVITIGDLAHPWLRGYVREQDLGRVKLGQKVKLSTDSYPGKDYWGTITFIASEAEFTPKQIQTTEERVKLVYRIKVEVDNRAMELKSNMPVDGVILLEQ